MVDQVVKKTQKERVNDKYGKMIDYYATVLARCHYSVMNNDYLSKLDPMGQKTSATTLFIRVCNRMDETNKQKSFTPENLMNISAKYAENVEKMVSNK